MNAERWIRAGDADELLQSWLAHYPEAVFPGPPWEQHEPTRDQIAAAMARHLLGQLRDDLDRLAEELPA